MSQLEHFPYCSTIVQYYMKVQIRYTTHQLRNFGSAKRTSKAAISSTDQSHASITKFRPLHNFKKSATWLLERADYWKVKGKLKSTQEEMEAANASLWWDEGQSRLWFTKILTKFFKSKCTSLIPLVVHQLARSQLKPTQNLDFTLSLQCRDWQYDNGNEETRKATVSYKK